MPRKRANEGKEPVYVYQMERAEAYFLLRLLMEITGKKHIGGVQKAFFEPETYKHHEKLIRSLAKKKYAQMKDGNLMISEDLKGNINRILESVHCMTFQNAEMMESESALSFYYSDGKYVGFLQNSKKVILAAHENPEAIYHVFQKHFDADGISKQFKIENWQMLWQGETFGETVREAMIMNTGNRLGRTKFMVSMISDGRQIQMLRGFADTAFDELNRVTMSAMYWHRVIVTELERLKDEHNYRCNIKSEEPEEEELVPLSDYRQIVSSPGFPKGRIGFLFWTLKCFVRGIPMLIKNLIRSKFVGLIVAAVWGLFIFLYNMYITCYFNDTFMLERRAKWGNLSPYLMGATLRTPSPLKGFDVDLGNIKTTFLVAPLFMLLTFLGRHLFLQFKERKVGFIRDFFASFGTARENRLNGFGKGRWVWAFMAFTFVVGFLMMNPISLFLSAFYAFLIYEQGKKNGLIQYIMLYRCAACQKRVDTGKMNEPDYRSINMIFYLFGCGMLFYGLISVLLWFVADYSFWIRAVVTLLMVIFAMIQACMPGLLTGKRAKALVGIVLFCVTAAVISRALPGGLVLADDGGWSESGGKILGLIKNAGFSTILGITLMTLGIALGGPVTWMIAGGAILGFGNFVLGLTDTKAGAYVRKSADQFFNGAAEGEDYTLLCTMTQVGSIISGFVNPATGASALAVKALQIGKVATDMISMADSTVDFWNSVQGYVEGTNSFSDVAWDALGLALDIYSTQSDLNDTFDEFAKINAQGDSYKYAPDISLEEKVSDIQKDQDRALQKSEYDFKQQYKELSNQDSLVNQYQKEISGLDREIHNIETGEIKPPSGMSKEEYIDVLNEYKNEAIEGLEDRTDVIRESVNREAKETADKINQMYEETVRDTVVNEWIDKGMDAGGKANSIRETVTDHAKTWENDEVASNKGETSEPQTDASKPMNGSTNQSAQQPENNPSSQPAQQPVNNPSSQPAQQPVNTPVSQPVQQPEKNVPQHSNQEQVNVTGNESEIGTDKTTGKRTSEYSSQESLKKEEQKSGTRTVTTISDMPSEGMSGEADEIIEIEENGEEGKKKTKKEKN